MFREEMNGLQGMIRFEQPERFFEYYLESMSNFLDIYYLVSPLNQKAHWFMHVYCTPFYSYDYYIEPLKSCAYADENFDKEDTRPEGSF
jgi:hypothetical protein